ncbi:hypothetical protein B0T22DRAFT_451151 [Podospora appendiculata]|uniref:Uncharacterized protein n=1 Tax=Podospora appendiculata TaxID=314037 RepID=A0AAE0XJ42_9PEZI|nr:hypothetical protein B0T22DRAFT_451151 [Podospora appendiculata]
MRNYSTSLRGQSAVQLAALAFCAAPRARAALCWCCAVAARECGFEVQGADCLPVFFMHLPNEQQRALTQPSPDSCGVTAYD